MKILLTGGSGFLGSALARDLLIKGHQITLLLRPSSTLERLHGLEDSFELVRYMDDVQIFECIQKFEPEAVIHTACAYGRNEESYVQIHDANVRFGLVLLQALLHTENSTQFINTGTVLEPEVNYYALTKHQFSQCGQNIALQSKGRLSFVNVLLQHMYGPGDDASKFTTHVLRSCMRNEAILKLTGGVQKRDFIYIDDVLSAYSTILNNYEKIKQVTEIEVGTGSAPTIREFVETVHRLTSSSTQLQFGALPYRNNEAMLCQADIDKIRTLGWKPKFDLVNGLRRTIDLELNK